MPSAPVPATLFRSTICHLIHIGKCLLLSSKVHTAFAEEQFISRPDFEAFLFRVCVVVDDRLQVIGGQEDDFMAKPGSPIFKCSRRLEVVYRDVYMLDESMKWKGLPPMPKPD